MEAWIIYDKTRYSQKNQFFANKLCNEFEALNVNAKIILTKDIKNKKNLPNIAVMRSTFKSYSYYLEKRGVRVANSFKVSSIFNDKWKTYLFLKKNSIPCMPTILYDGQCDIKFAFPIVIKSRYGHGGKQVFLANNKQELDHYFKIIGNKTAIIQPLVDKKSVDKRVYILGNSPIQAIKRVSKNDFRSNYTLGGNAIVDKITTKEMEIINKITNLISFDLAGIDIIYDKNQPLVNEVEDVVGCRMLYAKTNIDIVKEYVRYLVYGNEK